MILYCIVSTIIFIVITIYKKRKYEKSFYEYQNKIISEQLDEMNNLYKTMRGWRHDYHNHMQKIKAHLVLKQFDEAINYIDQMDDELDTIDITYKSGNVSVDAILNSKLTLAKKNGINIKCDAILPKELNIKQLDLCVVLGNLVDNAIEACQKISTENYPDNTPKFLRIYMCMMKKQLYISVSNATNEVVRKIDREYISNKRGNHGHGLKRINIIVNKYNGYINRQNEPGVFATEILLPDKEM